MVKQKALTPLYVYFAQSADFRLGRALCRRRVF